MPSFDVVSQIEMQEVVNAVDQAKREITTRYDFKGSKATFELKEKDNLIEVMADDDLKLKAMHEILKQKLAKRNVSLKSIEFKDPTAAGGDMLRQEILLKQGLTSDELKRLNKTIKAKKMKVTAAIQGDQLRVTGKKRDDLQEVISVLKAEVSDLELQFENFRD